MSREPEAKAPVYVLLKGVDHYWLNVKEPERYGSAIGGNIRRSRGEHVLFMEGALNTQEAGDRSAYAVNKTGFVRSFLTPVIRGKAHREITVADVQALANRLSKSDLPTIVSRALLPSAELHHYFRAVQLDVVRDKHKTITEFESHSTPTVEQLNSTNSDRENLGKKVEEEWGQGNFDQARAIYLNERELITQIDVLRDKDICSQLETSSDRLGRERGGSINVLIGGAHITRLSAGMMQFASLNPSVSIFDDNSEFQVHTEMKLQKAEMQGRDATPELVRMLMHELMSRSMDDLLHDHPLLIAGAASHYLDIRQSMIDVVNGMSFEDARMFCESKESVLTFFRRQPEAASIARFLTV